MFKMEWLKSYWQQGNIVSVQGTWWMFTYTQYCMVHKTTNLFDLSWAITHTERADMAKVGGEKLEKETWATSQGRVGLN